MIGWKNIFHENGKQKKPGAAILLPYKMNLNINNIARDKEGNFITIRDQFKRKIQHLQISIHPT